MLAVLASLPLVLAASPAAPPAHAAAPEESLQDFLRRARAERSALLEALRGPVTAAVERLERLPASARAEEWEEARSALRAGGAASAPLLVRHLEPGADGDEAAQRRAREVRDALAELGVDAIVDTLLETARVASRPARVLALELLAGAPPAKDVDAFLEDQARSAVGPIKHAALGAAVRRGTPGAAGLVDTALADGDGTALSTIFGALEGGPPERSEDVLLRAFQDTSHASSWMEGALARCRELPQPLSPTLFDKLSELVGDGSQRSAVRVELLGFLAQLEPNGDKKHRKRLEELTESTDDALRDAALVCLALAGDRGAKRALLTGLDDLVENNPNWAPAYEQRGDLQLRIRDYREAARDFKLAIELDEAARRGVSAETRVKLARAYAGDGKLKSSYEALRDAGLPRSRLDELAGEPIFRELVEHSRYGKVFTP